MSYSISDLQSLAEQDAEEYGVPVGLFEQQINIESGWNPNAYNQNSGAIGIAQFLPSTAADAGYGIPAFDPSDPAAALNAAAQYDAALYGSTGSWGAALAAYSGGGTTPQYQQLIEQADSGVFGADNASGPINTSATSGGSGSGGVTGWLYNHLPSNPITGLENWLTNSAVSVVGVIIGVVLLAGALFLLANKNGIPLPPLPVE